MKTCKNLSKRGLALFLALVMCLSMVQITAFAVDGHVHNEDGWSCTQDDSVRELSCDKHVHNDNCYQTVQGELTCEAEEHQHGDGCYEAAEPQLTCADAEHTHGDSCYTQGEDVLTCAETEHTHGEDCYAAETVKVCEEEDHQHGDECYTVTEGEWTCTAPVVEEAPAEEENNEAPVTYEVRDTGRTSNVTKSPYEDYAPNKDGASDLPVYNDGMVPDKNGAVTLTGDQKTATDYLQVRYYTNHGGAYATGYTWLTSSSTNKNVAAAKVSQSTLNGKPCLKVDFEAGSQTGSTTIEIGYTVVNLDNEHGIGTGNDFYMYVSGYVYYNVTNTGDGTTVEPVIPDYPDAANLQGITVTTKCTYNSNGHIYLNNNCYKVPRTLNGHPDGYVCSDIRENQGELGTSNLLARYPYACTLTLNREYWADYYNQTLASNSINKTHYLNSLQDSSKTTMTLLYNAEKDQWDYDTEELEVYVTETAPITYTYTVIYKDGANEDVFGDETHGKLNEGDNTPEFNGSLERQGYKFAGWMPTVNSVVSADDANENGEIIYTATWTKDNTPPPTENKPKAPVILGKDSKLRVQVVCDEHSGKKENLRLRAPENNSGVVEYTAGEVVESEKTGYDWQYTVTLYKSDFATRFAHNSKGDHDYVAGTKDTVDVTFYYKDGAWDYENVKEQNPGVEIVYEMNGDENYYVNYVLYHVAPKTVDPETKLLNIKKVFVGIEAEKIPANFGLSYRVDDGAPVKLDNSEAAKTDDGLTWTWKVQIPADAKTVAITESNANVAGKDLTVTTLKSTSVEYTVTVNGEEVQFPAASRSTDNGMVEVKPGDNSQRPTRPTGNVTGSASSGATGTVPPARRVTITNTYTDKTDPGPGPGPGVEPNRDGLKLTKAVDNSAPELGGTVTYTITVSNETKVDLKDLKIKDVMPEGVTLVEGSGKVTVDGAARNVTLSQNDQTCNWTVDGVIPVEGKVVLTYKATVPAAAEQEISLKNTAQAFANQNEAPAPQMAQGVAQYAASMANDFVSSSASTEVNVKGYEFTSNEGDATVTVKPSGGTEQPGDETPKIEVKDLQQVGVMVRCADDASHDSGTGWWQLGGEQKEDVLHPWVDTWRTIGEVEKVGDAYQCIVTLHAVPWANMRINGATLQATGIKHVFDEVKTGGKDIPVKFTYVDGVWTTDIKVVTVWLKEMTKTQTVRIFKVFNGPSLEEVEKIKDNFSISYTYELNGQTSTGTLSGKDATLTNRFEDGGFETHYYGTPVLYWDVEFEVNKGSTENSGAGMISFTESGKEISGWTWYDYDESFREEFPEWNMTGFHGPAPVFDNYGSYSSIGLSNYYQNSVTPPETEKITATWLPGYGDNAPIKVQQYDKGITTVPAGDYPADPTRDGYTFTGWGAPVIAENGNITITAQWRSNGGGGNGGGNGGGTTRYTLTVRYEYEDGTQAAPTYTERLARGDAYSVDSPVIEGYTPDQAVVSGEMPGRSLTVTVVYTPEGQDIPDEEPPLVDLPDEEPPLVNIPEEEPPLVEIPEEEPPLAETPLDPTPKTGDNSRTGLWAALCGFSLFGMLALLGKKREDEEA